MTIQEKKTACFEARLAYLQFARDLQTIRDLVQETKTQSMIISEGIELGAFDDDEVATFIENMKRHVHWLSFFAKKYPTQ